MRKFLFLLLFSFSYLLKAQVVLLSFEVSGNSTNTEINASWTTSMEINSNYFLLERSSDMISYATLDTILAAGNSNSNVNYSITDNSEVSAVCYYYRLTLVYSDTSYESIAPKKVCFAPIIAVNCEHKLTLSPNPIKDYSVICFDNQSQEKHSIFLYDIQGKLIQELVDFTSNYVIFKKYELGVGVYFYKLFKGNTLLKTEKFVVI
ncbi:MAG: T9SS type A sorting domain-containing protein [Bacteroidetes bacterium]|nr:T9SS type A sorting domain-containing protein [Bacteroidota bacterium]